MILSNINNNTECNFNEEHDEVLVISSGIMFSCDSVWTVVRISSFKSKID